MGYRLRVYLVLTSILAAAAISWELLRHESHGEEHEAWRAVTDTLRAQQGRIDSLEAALLRLDTQVDRHKRNLAAGQERLGHFERTAVGGRLPAPRYKEYLRAIEAHNEEVERHNAALAEMHTLYALYSALVDTHNALIDGANAMQRRATQEGYALPEADLRLRKELGGGD